MAMATLSSTRTCGCKPSPPSAPTARVREPDWEIAAAGGVVWRDGDRGREILLVHRPRYDDWSLPKGKLEPDETFEDAARREVEEETGVIGVLGDELPSARYDDSKGRSKIVRYWLMSVDRDGGWEPGDEVDSLRWVPVVDAPAELTYDHDVAVVDAAADLLRAGR
jgi:8-oxo-dGTP diphosphatase